MVRVTIGRAARGASEGIRSASEQLVMAMKDADPKAAEAWAILAVLVSAPILGKPVAPQVRAGDETESGVTKVSRSELEDNKRRRSTESSFDRH